MAANVVRGMTPDEARRAALLAIAGVDQRKEECREARGAAALNALGRDFRYACRSIVRNWRFSMGVVGVLTLGLGLSAAVFSIVNGVFLKPLPYPAANRLVWMWGTSPRIATASVTPADYVSYRSTLESFDHLAAMVRTSVDLVSDQGPQRVPGATVSWNFFETFGVRPVLGRGFVPDEERQSEPTVAVLSHGAWQRLFGGAGNIIGRQISLNRHAVTIVGVMPPQFRLQDNPDVWLPLPMLASNMT